MSSSPTRTQSGFTILEVVLAMGLLVMAMTSLLGLFTFGAALTRTAALRTAAATAIEAVVADLEESLFALEEDGSVGDPRVIVDRPVPGTSGVIYSALARVNPDDPDEFAVDVELSWEAGGVQRARKFTTLLLREVPFGERLRRRFIRARSFPPPPEMAPGEESQSAASSTPDRP
jgi:Tfp pilus assembly protein PilV